MVTPWNFPAAMATRKIGPALGAGCTVVLKPASDTPLTALLMAQILDDAGVPAGVVNVVPSRRSGAIVSAMVHDDRVRKLSFTGSTEVGRVLLKEAADTVVNTSMELGGNAPFLVFADADLDAALEGAMIAKMRNGGEACTAANRFYVEESVAEEFASRLAEKMGAMTVGPGTEDGTQVGPLVNDAAVQKCDELVRGRAGRGRPGPHRRSGARPAGLLLRPDGAGRRARRRRDPARGDLRAGRADRHLHRRGRGGRAAPTTPSSAWSPIVYTGDLARGLRVSEALESGMVGLNRGPRVGPGRAVRRRQAVRHRPRGRPRGAARLHREQVHRAQLVAAAHQPGASAPSTIGFRSGARHRFPPPR